LKEGRKCVVPRRGREAKKRKCMDGMREKTTQKRTKEEELAD
jgi:hypothetical protein